MNIEEYTIMLNIYDLTLLDVVVYICRDGNPDLYEMMIKISSDGKFEKRTAAVNFFEKKYSLSKSFKAI